MPSKPRPLPAPPVLCGSWCPGRHAPPPAPCSLLGWRLVTARVWFRSDPECEGHRCENGVYDPQQDDGDESADEDSCSEHSSSTSTSTNQKEGKYCDCCYCEFFGHGGVSAAEARTARPLACARPEEAMTTPELCVRVTAFLHVCDFKTIDELGASRTAGRGAVGPRRCTAMRWVLAVRGVHVGCLLPEPRGC